MAFGLFCGMNWEDITVLDLVLGAWLAWALFDGFRKGLIIKVASIAALVMGVYAGFAFSSFAADWLSEVVKWPKKSIAIGAFVLTFIGVVLGVHFLAKLIEKLVDLTALSLINKLGGMVLGLVQSVLFISSLTFALDSVFGPRNWLPKEQAENSILFPAIETAIETVIPSLSRETTWDALQDQLQNGIERLEEAVEESGLTSPS